MKQKILMLLAAVLLSSVSAFAQSGNDTTPLKGDVNGDGKVDVADIAAVIEIMKNGGGIGGETKYYWYVGTTKPTSLSQATVVDSYPAEQIYTNNSGAKSHIFVLTNSDKTVTFINIPLNAEVTQTEVDITTIPGYKIWETAVGVANTGSIKIRISDVPTYYSYVGTDKSEKLVNASTGELKSDIATQIKTISGIKTYTSIPTSLTAGTTIEAGGDYVYVIAPTATLDNATVYLVNQLNITVSTPTIGTFNIGSTEYTVKCTPSEVGTVITAWK